MPELILLPTGTVVPLPPGTTLLAAIGRAGAPIGQSCRGQGVCNSCRVRIEAGADALTPPAADELSWRVPAPWRLACRARAAPGTAPGARIAAWCAAWGPPSEDAPSADPP
jgi:ferredoxin